MTTALPSRCFIGSVVGHTALCALLIFAPGFQTKPTDLATGGVPLEIISSELVNGALAPAASEEPPASAPAAELPAERTTVAPEPVPTPPPARVPEPEVPPARPEPRTPTKSVLDAPESSSRDFVVPTRKTPEKKTPPAKTPPKKKEEPKFDFSQARSVPDSKTRKPAAQAKDTPKTATPSEDPSKARARALGGILAQATGSLTGTGGGRGAVNIQISGGSPGTGGGAGGGIGSVNALSIRNAYFAAWVTPPNVTDDLATVETEVTIQRNGSVTHARVTRRSGIAALDRSIDDALQRVKRITPFDAYPDPALEQQTFKIGFNLRARRQF